MNEFHLYACLLRLYCLDDFVVCVCVCMCVCARTAATVRGGWRSLVNQLDQVILISTRTQNKFQYLSFLALLSSI